MDKIKISYVRLVIIFIVAFIFSLVVDFLMGKPYDHFYAFFLGIIFVVVFFVLEYGIKHRMGTLRSKYA